MTRVTCADAATRRAPSQARANGSTHPAGLPSRPENIRTVALEGFEEESDTDRVWDLSNSLIDDCGSDLTLNTIFLSISHRSL